MSMIHKKRHKRIYLKSLQNCFQLRHKAQRARLPEASILMDQFEVAKELRRAIRQNKVMKWKLLCKRWVSIHGSELYIVMSQLRGSFNR